MRVVVDTNIVVSAFLAAHGTSALILRFWRQGNFELLLSTTILMEYRRALFYEEVRSRHRLTDQEIETALTAFGKNGVHIDPTRTVFIIERDPSDNMFLECALAGQADYIVSGDRHLRDVGIFEEIPILAPAMFRDVLQREGLINDA